MQGSEKQKRLCVCGLICRFSSEKWAELSAQIAFDHLPFMSGSYILIYVLLTSLAPLLSSQGEL